MKLLLLVIILLCTGCVGLYGPDVPRPVVVVPPPVYVEPVYVPVYVYPYYRWRRW